MPYSEDLRNPLWQKRRLEILQASNWKCCECGSALNTLEIHHSHYLRNAKPWEHPDELLICLCSDCHLARQNVEDSIKIEMMKRLHRVPLERLKKLFWAIMQSAMKEAGL